MPRHLYDIKRKESVRLGMFAFAGMCTALSSAVFFGGDIYAAAPSITFGTETMAGSNEIVVDGSENGIGHYYKALPITFTNAETYSIYIHGDTELTGEEDSNNKIHTLTADKSSNAMSSETDAWGYRAHFGAATEDTSAVRTTLATKDYTGVKVEGQKDTVAEDVVIHGNYAGRLTLELIAAVNGDIAADSYGGEIYVSAIAAPFFVTLFDLTNMQDMTSDACRNTPTPTAAATASANTLAKARGKEKYDGTNLATYTASTNVTSVVPERSLVDTRNSKSYTVRKLADGNCWMTQNLNYTPAVNTVLTDEKTDFTESTVKSYTVGANQLWEGSGTGYAGNTYYNWVAATAGAGANGAIDAGDRTDRSICPRGWRLPTGGAIEDATGADGLKNGEFQRLADIYSIGDNAAGNTKIQSAPLSFPLSGFYLGSFDGAGSFGRWWSSTSHSTSFAYRFRVDTSGVNPQDHGNHTGGFTVRCMAR